jgi:hypothetical protein
MTMYRRAGIHAQEGDSTTAMCGRLDLRPDGDTGVAAYAKPS